MTTKSKMALLLLLTPVPNGCQQHGDSHSSPINAPTVSAESDVDTGIATAIRAHLAHNSNLNPNAFDTEVKRVTMNGDHAQADVEFHVKNGPGVMQLTYALVRQNGAWSVAESIPGSSNFSHPQLNSTSAQPGAGSPTGPSIFRAMDNFHGATPAQKLPPGHPPLAPTPTSDPAKAP